MFSGQFLKQTCGRENKESYETRKAREGWQNTKSEFRREPQKPMGSGVRGRAAKVDDVGARGRVAEASGVRDSRRSHGVLIVARVHKGDRRMEDGVGRETC